MKKVIVLAMDFSEGAMNALNFAIRTANAVKSNILMVWVDKKKLIANTVYSNANDPRLEAKNRFEQIIEEYSDKLTGGKFLYKIRNGKVHKEITNQAKYHDGHMIIAGTHGTSGFEEFWLGSNANKIVANAQCPVITIKYNEDAFKPIKKLLVPIDSTRETRQKIPFVTYLAKCFGATIQLVSLYSTSVESIKKLVDDYSDQAKKYIEDYDIAVEHHKLKVENITRSTIEFAKENDTDLICIMTDQESSPINLLLGPYAQQMVNHSPIPVLSIRSKSIYDYQTK